MPATIKLPLAFEWRVNAPSGVFTGQQKALLVDKMEELAERIAQGRAKLEFSYDKGSVIAKITAKTSPAMRERAAAKAHRDATAGLRGLVAKALLFWHRLGPDAKAELERRLAADYLKEEQGRATAELLDSFKIIMAPAQALGAVGAAPSTRQSS